MLRLLKALYDAGVTIIPGTDALAGYTLHHELELYVRAGIAPTEVLRMATLTPALVMGVRQSLRSGCNREIARYHSALNWATGTSLTEKPQSFQVHGLSGRPHRL